MTTTTPTASSKSSTKPSVTSLIIIGTLTLLVAGTAMFMVAYHTFVRAISCKTADLTTETRMRLSFGQIEFYDTHCLNNTTHTAWLPSALGALGVAAMTMVVLIGASWLLYLVHHSIRLSRGTCTGYHFATMPYHLDVALHWLLWGSLFLVAGAMITHQALAGQ